MKVILQLSLLLILLSVANGCVNADLGKLLNYRKLKSLIGFNKLNLSARFVRETIAEHKVVIFSKSYCQYSTMAKEQFRKLNFPFHAVELDNRPDGNVIQEILGEMTGASTVPRVFVDAKFIGGGTDVKKLNESGDLKKLLKIQK